MVGTVQTAHEFFYFPKRQSLLEEITKDVCNEEGRTKLLNACKTRWIERIDCLKVFRRLHQAIVVCLAKIKNNLDGSWNKDSYVDAKGLFAACSSYEFIIALVISGKGLSLSTVRPATAKLKYDDIGIVKGYQEIDLLSKCKDIGKISTLATINGMIELKELQRKSMSPHHELATSKHSSTIQMLKIHNHITEY